MSTTMHALIGLTSLGKRVNEEENKENEDYDNLYKLIRTQQYLACLNSISGPKATPLPAQIPLKVSFKMKLPNLFAGVKLNFDQNSNLTLGHINMIIEKINQNLPNNNALLWVEEDDLIDDQWEELNITDADDALTARSSYLSSFLTGWTGGWTTTNNTTTDTPNSP